MGGLPNLLRQLFDRSTKRDTLNSPDPVAGAAHIAPDALGRLEEAIAGYDRAFAGGTTRSQVEAG